MKSEKKIWIKKYLNKNQKSFISLIYIDFCLNKVPLEFLYYSHLNFLSFDVKFLCFKCSFKCCV